MDIVHGDIEDEDDATSPCLSIETQMVLKHDDIEGSPLNSHWTLWIDKSEKGLSHKEYLAGLKRIYTVSTVTGFWSLYNHIPPVDELCINCSYHFMRCDRKPIWEEEVNQEGGSWRIKLEKTHTRALWKELLLAAIGEQFDGHVAAGDDVCGISVTIRENHNVIFVWDANSKLAESSTVLQKIHELVPEMKFVAEFYKSHRISQRK